MILYIGNKNSPTPSTIDTLGEQLKESFDVVTTSKIQNKLLRLLDMAKDIVKYRKSCELLIVDTYSTKNFYYAWMTAFFARRFNIPYIPILHGGNLDERLQKNPKMSHYIFSQAAINITPSLFLKELFTKKGYSTTYIPNNIPLEKYPFKMRERVGPKLLYVRSFAEIYNPLMAIRALKHLSETYHDATLTMVGPDRDGYLEKTKAFAKELGLENRVTFTGKMDKDAWISLSSHHDIFINPTNFDNFPVSIVEAMALGLPIVSTDAGGLPYLIKDGEDGLLVCKNDDIVMSQKIALLLQDPKLCKKLSENARKKATTYDWKVIKKKWETVIKDVKK